ncbi:VOC family protein [Neorhodopirellula lusitana]|uniref:VOC family protein n=1 Tax=Neorhodopirellula lusitana TaxID=445327 RepID=UPI00384D6C43
MSSNPVGWFEIYVSDLERATKFYETVLAVKLEKLDSPSPEVEMVAFPIAMDGPGASGALTKMDGVAPGGNSVMVYFSCTDCATEAARIEDAGGSLQQPKTDIGDYGFCAMAVDTEGNTFGLHSSQ